MGRMLKRTYIPLGEKDGLVYSIGLKQYPTPLTVRIISCAVPSFTSSQFLNPLVFRVILGGRFLRLLCRRSNYLRLLWLLSAYYSDLRVLILFILSSCLS